jgi:hypothetical protein
MCQRRSDDDTQDGANGSIAARLAVLESQLTELLGSPAIRFNDRCRSALPEAHGIYRTKPFGQDAQRPRLADYGNACTRII